MKKKYKIDLFRFPDEAYIIDYKNGRKVIKILEKKNQNIRDDILIMNGVNPSYTRQTENAIKQQNGDG